MIRENIEGQAAWNVPPDPPRRPGLTALLRVKDEAEWILPSLESLGGLADEIVIALQGGQSDGTDRLVAAWAAGRPEVRVLHYPFDSLPNGPGHDTQPRGSLYERAYFYNWCLAQAGREHVLKWDGDMVALDWLLPEVRRQISAGRPVQRISGVEIAGLAPLRVSARAPETACEIRVFPAAGWWFETGSHCERLNRQEPGFRLIRPGFLHFKWVKAPSSAAKAWPADWEAVPHFQDLVARGEPGRRYRGEMPAVLCGTGGDRETERLEAALEVGHG